MRFLTIFSLDLFFSQEAKSRNQFLKQLKISNFLTSNTFSNPKKDFCCKESRCKIIEIVRALSECSGYFYRYPAVGRKFL